MIKLQELLFNMNKNWASALYQAIIGKSNFQIYLDLFLHIEKHQIEWQLKNTPNILHQ